MKYLFESATARCVGHFIPCKLQMQFEQVLFFICRECDYGERKRKSSVTCRLTSAERSASMLGVLIVCKRDVSRRTIRGRSRCITFFAFCNIKIKENEKKISNSWDQLHDYVLQVDCVTIPSYILIIKSSLRKIVLSCISALLCDDKGTECRIFQR